MKREFMIEEVLPGKLNALVKNIMKQMGDCDDPIEAVRRINSGEWIVSKATNMIQIDRSKSFDAGKFLGKGWKIEEEDKRSLALTELDLTKVQFENILKSGESSVNGKEKQNRLVKAGYICLDAKIFQTLWENNALIPSLWKERISDDSGRDARYIYFDGTILRDPDGNRYVLYLFYLGDLWYWRCHRLSDDWIAYSFSAVLASN